MNLLGIDVIAWVLGVGVVVGAVQVPPGEAERLGASGLPERPEGNDEPVVMVGELAVRRSDVFREMDLAAPRLAEDVVRQQVLDLLTRAEAAEHGIDVAAGLVEERVAAELADQRTRFAAGAKGGVTLEEYLADRHRLTPEEHAQLVRVRVLSASLLDSVVRFDQLSWARDDLQLLLLEDAELASSLSDKVQRGASFTALAKKYSVHPSAAAGGWLPVVPADVETPLVEGRGVLAVGEVLGPVAVTLGGRDYWRLLRLVERYEARQAAWSEVREEIEAGLIERPLHADELAVFEERMIDRYRVTRP